MEKIEINALSRLRAHKEGRWTCTKSMKKGHQRDYIWEKRIRHQARQPISSLIYHEQGTCHRAEKDHQDAVFIQVKRGTSKVRMGQSTSRNPTDKQ